MHVCVCEHILPLVNIMIACARGQLVRRNGADPNARNKRGVESFRECRESSRAGAAVYMCVGYARHVSMRYKVKN